MFAFVVGDLSPQDFVVSLNELSCYCSEYN